MPVLLHNVHNIHVQCQLITKKRVDENVHIYIQRITKTISGTH